MLQAVHSKALRSARRLLQNGPGAGAWGMLTSPVTAYADDSLNVPNVIEDLFPGSDHSHRAYQERVDRHRATHSNPAQPTG